MELVASRLQELEAIIDNGLRTFADVGRALTEIREALLYRSQGYATFEAYCKERWDLSKSYAYRAIEHAEVIGALSPIGDIPPPANEAQTRELLPLYKAAPELVVETWRGLREDFGDALTAELVGRRVKDIFGARRIEETPDDEDLNLRGREVRGYVRETDGLRGFNGFQLTYFYVGLRGEPEEWHSGRIAVDHQTPITDQDVIDVARSVGQSFAREMFKRPLPTMKRKVG